MALQILADYLGLITSQHRDKPKYMAMIEGVASRFVGVAEVLDQIRRGFDLDTGVGVQLDHVGEWIGRARRIEVELQGVYFSWDEAGVGWGEGTWKGPYDPDTGLVSLPDEPYRMLLRAKVAANHWEGTTDDAYEAWDIIFGDTGAIIVIQDNQDMSVIVGIAGMPLDAVSLQLLLRGYIPLKPEGVRVSYYAVTPDGGPLFGWDTTTDALNGWDAGRWPDILAPIY